MELISSPQRRVAGLGSLFVALLLVLSAVVLASPASAAAADAPCNEHGYTKIEAGSGEETFEWGTIKWGADAGDLDSDDTTTELSYDIESGYFVEFCLKAGTIDNTFTGPHSGTGYVSHPNPSISHIGYRLVTPEATPTEPTFIDPNCDEPDAAAVILPETTGVDYSSTGDVEPGGTVTVTATPQAGYAFPDGATDEWVHTFAELDEPCEAPIATTTAPTFTDPTCEDNSVALELPDSEGVEYAVDGTVAPGETVNVTATATGDYVLEEGADTEWEHVFPAAKTAEDCPTPSVTPPDETDVAPSVTTPDEPEVEVLPNVIEKPAPAPAEQPAAQAAAQELPATGLDSTELLMLALLLMGLGAAALLGPERRRVV